MWAVKGAETVKCKAAVPLVPSSVTADDVGAKVAVQGYDAIGTLQFFGKHKEKGSLRCGVAYDAAIGKNNGTIGGHWYFECPALHGILVSPNKVAIVSLDGTAFDKPPPMSPIYATADDSLPGFNGTEIAMSESGTFPSGDGGRPGEISTDLAGCDPATQQDENHGVIYASKDEVMAAVGPASPVSPAADLDALYSTSVKKSDRAAPRYVEIPDLKADDSGDGTTFDEPPALSPTVEADENDENDEAAAPVTQSWTFPPADGEGVPAVAESEMPDSTLSALAVESDAAADTADSEMPDVAAIKPAGEDELDAIDVEEDPPTAE